MPLNAVEREPVPTRVLNPNASEASYKPKQQTETKTKLKKVYFFQGDFIREPFWSHYNGPLSKFFNNWFMSLKYGTNYI